MSTIEKINFNNLFYFDNINSNLSDCLQIKQICSKWSNAKNFIRFAQLNFNDSSLFNIQKFIKDTHKHPKNYILCTKYKNGKILYISYLNESKDVKNAVEIDVLANCKRKVDPMLNKEDFLNIWQHYLQCTISMSNTKKYEEILFNIHKDNRLMHKTVQRGLCTFLGENNFPIFCNTKKGDYMEYRIKL
tara:strand:- start:611 stop:1177 length:567 start_codon:yes stop_codon:yes gene_type:complete